MKYNITSVLLFAIFMLFGSCSEKTNPVKQDVELRSHTLGDKMPNDAAKNIFVSAPITTEGVPQLNEIEDCHGKRAVTQSLEEVNGMSTKVAGTFVISTDDGARRYNPCALPKKLNKEGMLVRFTGKVLEVRAGERLFATPFRVENIVEREP